MLNNIEFGKFPYDKDYQVKIEAGRQCGKSFRAGMEFSNKIWKDKIEELENYYRELYKQDNSPNEFLIGQDCLSKLSILQEIKHSVLGREE